MFQRVQAFASCQCWPTFMLFYKCTSLLFFNILIVFDIMLLVLLNFSSAMARMLSFSITKDLLVSSSYYYHSFKSNINCCHSSRLNINCYWPISNFEYRMAKAIVVCYTLFDLLFVIAKLARCGEVDAKVHPHQLSTFFSWPFSWS